MLSLLAALSKGNLRKNLLYKALLLKGGDQTQLFKLARKKRREHSSRQEIEVRSVIEISNICRQNCNFCNINSLSREKGYTLEYEKIIEIVKYIYSKGRRVLLIQSGENSSQNYIDFTAKYIRDVKQKFNDLTIILCLGNLTNAQYKQLRISGADRYILKFETSNDKLYKQIKPNDSLERRIGCLNQLIELGFDVGTGNIIGLPNQSINDIVNDLFFISAFRLTMVSSSVFIPGENSNYRNKPMGDLNLTLNFMALLRIMYPKMLIPATSSLEKAKQSGQYLGLMAGANTVTIHDGTPLELKKYFPIYSNSRFTPDEKHIKNIVSKAELKFSAKIMSD